MSTIIEYKDAAKGGGDAAAAAGDQGTCKRRKWNGIAEPRRKGSMQIVANVGFPCCLCLRDFGLHQEYYKVCCRTDKTTPDQ